MTDHCPAAILDAVHACRTDVDRRSGTVDLDASALETNDESESFGGEVMQLFGVHVPAQLLVGLRLPGRADRVPADEQLAERAHVRDIVRVRPKLQHGRYVTAQHVIECAVERVGGIFKRGRHAVPFVVGTPDPSVPVPRCKRNPIQNPTHPGTHCRSDRKATAPTSRRWRPKAAVTSPRLWLPLTSV